MARRSDCYAQYRREHLTPSEAPSPITFVQDLYRNLYHSLPDWSRREIAHDMDELGHMIDTAPNSRTTGDNVICIPPMHWHPRTVIRTAMDILEIREATRNTMPGPTTLDMANKVISYWTSANSLKQLHRFTDSRHPVLPQIPLPDGSNIGNISSSDPGASLQDEWAFRRAFVRFLHLPGLWFSGERPWERHEAFTQLYGIGRCLLELEVERCSPITTADGAESYLTSPFDPNGYLFSWITPTREVVEATLDHVAAAAYRDPPTLRSRFFGNRAALTNEERLRRNLSEECMPAMLDEMIRRYDNLMARYPFERLVMDLLEREDTFEQLLTHEHVEDRLINKQIVPHDELDIVQGPEYDLRALDNSFDGSKENPSGIHLENFIHKVAGSISLVNRQRRNFRLIREWIKHRPWHTLIHVYNSSIPGNEWQSEAIQVFHERGLRDIYNDDPFIPSHPLNLLGSLFGIHPYDINEPDLRRENPFICGICRKAAAGGNEPTNTMAILPCTYRHIFHLGCVMSYWDQDGKYTHSCPICGRAPPITHERLGMYPNNDDPYFNIAHPTFVNNPFGYITRHAVPPNLTPIGNHDFSLSRRYWERENILSAAVMDAPLKWEGEIIDIEALARRDGRREFVNMSGRIGNRWKLRNFDLLHSAGFVMEGEYDAARFLPSQEVAWLRMRRRGRDRIRRKKLADAGQGLIRYRPYASPGIAELILDT